MQVVVGTLTSDENVVYDNKQKENVNDVLSKPRKYKRQQKHRK